MLGKRPIQPWKEGSQLQLPKVGKNAYKVNQQMLQQLVTFRYVCFMLLAEPKRVLNRNLDCLEGRLSRQHPM